MAVNYYDANYLASLFGVTKEKFHKEIKPTIVSDFRKELLQHKIKNPDIGVDENNFLFLSDFNRSYEIPTELKIEDYNEQ